MSGKLFVQIVVLIIIGAVVLVGVKMNARRFCKMSSKCPACAAMQK